MSYRVASLLIRYRHVLLAVAALLALLSWPASRQLQLSWNVESMFPSGHPLVESYQRLQTRFGGNQIVLVVYSDPSAWAPSGEGLDRLSQVSERIAAVDGVASVLSLAEVDQILRSISAPGSFFDLGRKEPPALLDDENRLAAAFKEVFTGYTHSSDGKTFALACILDLSDDPDGLDTGENEATSKTTSRQGEIVDRLRDAVKSLPEPANSALVTGEPVLVADGYRIVTQDGLRLRIASTILVVLVLLLCFRSIRWTLIPLAVVQFSILLTEATLAWLGLELTMISSTLAAVLTVIGVATSMHILLQYQNRRRSGDSREVALERTFGSLLPAISWAILTDAIGFSALMFASVGPVQDFGLMMTLGSAAVLVAILLLTPGLALIGKWSPDPSTPQIDLLLRHRLRALFKLLERNRLIGRAVLAVLFIVAAVGCWLAKLETDFTKNFASDSEIVRGYSLVEQKLGGAGVWDIMVPAPDLISNAYMNRLSEFQEELRGLSVTNSIDQSVQLSKVLSVVDADQASLESSIAAALPVDARIRAIRAAMPAFSSALICYDAAGDGNWIRIMLRSQEQAPADKKQQLIEKVRAATRKLTNDPAFQETLGNRSTGTTKKQPRTAEVAGYHVMLGELVASVLRDQWICFFVAALGIAGVVRLATGMFRFALIVMITNMLPILLVIGSMGWLGMRVNMGAAMISAVSLGLSVDSSIHYLLHFKRRTGEVPPKRALLSAQENVGLAAILATTALIAGFMSMASSEFVPTVVFGTLTSLTMLGGLVGNLVVLPLLFPASQLHNGKPPAND